VQFAVQTNYFILKKRIMLLHFLQRKLAATTLYSLFKWNGYVIHDWAPGRSPGALCSNHTKPTMLPFCCLLPFVSTYHCEHRSGYKRRSTKNSRLESPFFQRFRG